MVINHSTSLGSITSI